MSNARSRWRAVVVTAVASLAPVLSASAQEQTVWLPGAVELEDEGHGSFGLHFVGASTHAAPGNENFAEPKFMGLAAQRGTWGGERWHGHARLGLAALPDRKRDGQIQPSTSVSVVPAVAAFASFDAVEGKYGGFAPWGGATVAFSDEGGVMPIAGLGFHAEAGPPVLRFDTSVPLLTPILPVGGLVWMAIFPALASEVGLSTAVGRVRVRAGLVTLAITRFDVRYVAPKFYVGAGLIKPLVWGAVGGEVQVGMRL